MTFFTIGLIFSYPFQRRIPALPFPRGARLPTGVGSYLFALVKNVQFDRNFHFGTRDGVSIHRVPAVAAM